MVQKKSDFDQFQVRLPPGMRERIRIAAEDSKRSMNAEIVHRLDESFESYAFVMDFETGKARRSPPTMSIGDYLYQTMSEVELIRLLERYASELQELSKALEIKRYERDER